MSNYAPRYAALCEKWPELRHPDIRFFGDNWSLTLVEYNDELDGGVRHASSTPILLALIRAKLEDGLPDDVALIKYGDGHATVKFDIRKECLWDVSDEYKEALDALLAWWEGRTD